MTVGAAILCPAVCVSDIKNKAGMFSESIRQSPFRLFLVQEQMNTAVHWGAQIPNKKYVLYKC